MSQTNKYKALEVGGLVKKNTRVEGTRCTWKRYIRVRQETKERMGAQDLGGKELHSSPARGQKARYRTLDQCTGGVSDARQWQNNKLGSGGAKSVPTWLNKERQETKQKDEERGRKMEGVILRMKFLENSSKTVPRCDEPTANEGDQT